MEEEGVLAGIVDVEDGAEATDVAEEFGEGVGEAWEEDKEEEAAAQIGEEEVGVLFCAKGER